MKERKKEKEKVNRRETEDWRWGKKKKFEEASWESAEINKGVGIGGFWILSENDGGRWGLIINGDGGGRWKSVGIG